MVLDYRKESLFFVRFGLLFLFLLLLLLLFVHLFDLGFASCDEITYAERTAVFSQYLSRMGQAEIDTMVT